MYLFRKKDVSTMVSEADGVLKRSLTMPQLVALGIGAVVGAGIFVITGQAAADYAGPALAISFLISAACCIISAMCYAEFAAMMPVSGSVYSYSYATMGEFLAWFIGWSLILEYLFACSSVSVAWSGYINSLFHGWGMDLPASLSQATLLHTAKDGWAFSGSIINFPAVAIVVIVTALLMGNIGQSAFINNIIVLIKVLVILLFIGFGLSYVDVDNLTPYIPENTGEYGHYGWSGIFRGAAVVFYAFLGFDALSTAAQETHNPQKNMPRAILISLIICALLYVAVTTVLTGIVNYKELAVDAPIAVAIDKAGEGLAWLSPFIKLGAILGLSSVILVMMLGQTRIYYAISSDGLLPKFFSHIRKKTQTPYKATIAAGGVTALIAGLLPLDVLSELVSIGTLMAFTIVCVSVIVLRRTQPQLKRPFKVPWVPVLPIIGAAFCLLQMVSLPWNTWLRLIGWTAVGLLIYFCYGRYHSKLNKENIKS